jgi:anti-sigma B factor antagonist
MDENAVPGLSSARVEDLLEAATDETMAVTVHSGTEIAIVCVAGEIEMRTASRLRDVLLAELAARPTLLVVDLDAVTFLSSQGLAVLAVAAGAAQEHGVDIRVVASNRAVLRPLQVTGLTDEVAVYATRADAMGPPTGAPDALPPHRIGSP